MNLFEKFVNAISATTDNSPETFGLFHILFVVAIIAFTVFICIRFKNADDKTFRRIIMICWIVLVVGELYREIVFSFDLVGDIVSWEYAWYQFPFQFCSSPLYTFPLLAFLPEGKVRNVAMAYVGNFALVGGIAVTFYPGNVLCDIIGINYQSMIHHGLQFAIGAYVLVRERNKIITPKYFGYGYLGFGILASIAMILNLTVHPLLVANNIDDSFNMFYISPYYECALPVLVDIQKVVPYPVFLFLYCFAVFLAGALVYAISLGIMKGTRYARKKLKCKK